MITISKEVTENISVSITNILCWFAGYYGFTVTARNEMDDLLASSINILREFNTQIRIKLDEK